MEEVGRLGLGGVLGIWVGEMKECDGWEKWE